MALFRRRRELDDVTPAAEAAAPEVVGPQDPARAAGPWDESERSTEGDPSYVDLGALRIRGRAGMEVRLQSDGGDDRIGAALIVTGDSALELRAFAAPRASGQWEQARSDIVEEVTRLGGRHAEVDGPFGVELRISIPVTTEGGQPAVQPSRIIGVEGPRWMLRATLLGRSALEPSDDDVLLEVLRDVVVVRGRHAMMAREAMLLTPPASAVVPEPDHDGTQVD